MTATGPLEYDALRRTLFLIGAGIEGLAESDQQVEDLWRTVQVGLSLLQSGRVDVAGQVAVELERHGGGPARPLVTPPAG
jgi:hypothetical protein